MKRQYCKVGAVTPITQGQQAVAVLEFRYQNFLEKAADLTYTDTKLAEFFEQKAQKIKKVLENLV